MTTYFQHQIATARIDDLHAEADGRRLARACRNPRGRFSLRTRISAQRSSENAEWWGAAATATGRGLPA